MEAIPELQRIVGVESDPVVKQAAENALERLQLDRS
jgi:hypothetical protein